MLPIQYFRGVVIIIAVEVANPVAKQQHRPNCHTCFKNPVVRFEQSENVAVHLYSLIKSAATMPWGVYSLRDRYGFKVRSVVRYIYSTRGLGST